MAYDDEQRTEDGEPTLHDEVLEALRARHQWEQRQRIWYEMRHNGLRRKSKPFPDAADLHFPLVDSVIEQAKPFYHQQLFATELVAEFVTTADDQPEAHDMAQEAARWFDHQIRENTNLEEESLTLADHMLLSGRAPLKVIWNNDEGEVEFEAIDPLYFVVPEGTRKLERAPWCVHIMHFSPAEYRRKTHWNQDKEFVRRITGRGEDDAGNTEDERDRREGLTVGGDNQIIVYEMYCKDGDKVKVKTYSPLRPDEPIREEFTLGYIDEVKFEKGEDGRENRRNITGYPFVDFPYEIKDAGWYSPRGAAEMVAAFETSLCKMWNEKHDAMTFYNRPVYANRGNKPFNAGNVKLRPGEVIEANIDAINQGGPPVSWDQEMAQTRTIAERRVMSPDFGVGQDQSHRDRKTATEVQRIGSLMDVSVNLRARIHRRRLAKVLQLAWARLLQFKKDQLDYRHQEKTAKAPSAALHHRYAIRPSGSAESWNAPRQQQKAMALWEMFRGDPFIDQGELRQTVLETVDPIYAQRLFRDPEVAAQDEQQAQAMELVLMLHGWPVPPQEHQDHAARVPVILGKLEQLGARNEPVDPQAQQLIMRHLQERMEMLKATDREAHAALSDQIRAMGGPGEGGGVAEFPAGAGGGGMPR